jgi:hypothetical protein
MEWDESVATGWRAVSEYVYGCDGEYGNCGSF